MTEESAQRQAVRYRRDVIHLQVRSTQCSTCIYRPDSTLDIDHLESQVKDRHGCFDGYRSCHHHPDRDDVCCRGFWNRHGDKVTVCRIARMFGMVEYSDTGDVTEAVTP